MRRLIYPALILLPVLAQAQAKTQTSTLTAVQSPAPAATLVAKANQPHVLSSAPATTNSAGHASDIMVPIHQTVVERSSEDASLNDSTIGFSFDNNPVSATAAKLIHAAPLTLSLRDMAAESDEAAVRLEFTVDLTGTPKNVKVVRSGGTTLDQRAIDAVNQYRFKPATQNNIPVEALVTVEIKIKKS
jgi:TonB family protein